MLEPFKNTSDVVENVLYAMLQYSSWQGMFFLFDEE